MQSHQGPPSPLGLWVSKADGHQDVVEQALPTAPSEQV